VIKAAPVVCAAAVVPAVASEPEDPIVPVYREWCAAREDWRRTARKPGNENWDTAECLAAQEREEDAAYELAEMTPTSMAGIAALAHVLWEINGPGILPGSEDYDQECEAIHNKLMLCIWRGASGKTDVPPVGSQEGSA